MYQTYNFYYYFLVPLPVKNLRATTDEGTSVINLHWTPDINGVQDEFLITYHEVDTINGDSNDITSNLTSLELENLLPGRNYSIIVQAVSNIVASNQTSIYVITKPSAPIIEDLRPIIDGLNISWKSDVNSRQDKYEVQYTRNDTGDRETRVTQDTQIVLRGLYPGSGYEIKVYAVSHEGLRSEPHKHFQAVCKYFILPFNF